MLAWGVGLGLLGAILGSFLATAAIRWPQGRSALRGRSACDTCGERLTAADLVPLFSAVVLRGRCRRCGAAIDPSHWRIEVLAAAIGAAAGLVAASPEAVAGAAFGWLLLLAAALDAGELWIPDPLTAAIAAAGLLAATAFPPPLVERLIGGAAGFASLWMIAAGYRLLRQREGLGGADPKLFGAIGLWIGWSLLPAVLTIAALVGLSHAALARIGGRVVEADTAFPFGTYLAIAAYPAWLVMVGMRP